MNDVLNMLMQEHARIRAMLTQFRRQLERFQRDESPDYDILDGSIAYCSDFLDQYHHPKEDALLELLRKRKADMMMGMDELTRQHETLAETTKEITQIFADVSKRGGVYLREDLLTRGLSLCSLYDDHLQWEETNFFPALERDLMSADWNVVADKFKATDPLASHPIDNRYQLLFLAIADTPPA